MIISVIQVYVYPFVMIASAFLERLATQAERNQSNSTRDGCVVGTPLALQPGPGVMTLLRISRRYVGPGVIVMEYRKNLRERRW